MRFFKPVARAVDNVYQQSELYMQAHKVTQLRERVEISRSQMDSLTMELTTIENSIIEVKNAIILKEERCQAIIKEKSEKSEESDHLKDRIIKINSSFSELIERKTFYVNLQQELQSRLNLINQKKDALTNRIHELNNIINSPSPEPHYELDGLYCINNIYMCKNHPPRKVLSNAKEIAAHQNEVAWARAEVQKLYSQQNILQNQIDELTRQYQQTEYNLMSIESKIIEFDNEKHQTETEIDNINKAISNLECEHNNILGEITEFNNQYHTMQARQQYISNEIESLNQMINTAENQLIEEQIKLQRLEEDAEHFKAQQIHISDTDLEALAKKELEQEAAPNQSNDKAVSDNDLERLARQELAEERQSQSHRIGDVMQNTADRLLDNAIDQARSIGAITEQARQNLRAIKNFGNRVNDQLQQELDDFMHASNNTP